MAKGAVCSFVLDVLEICFKFSRCFKLFYNFPWFHFKCRTLVYHSTVLCSNFRRDDLRIWFKREELAHTGAHKINNAIGQAGK